jgi:hypothetical protein
MAYLFLKNLFIGIRDCRGDPHDSAVFAAGSPHPRSSRPTHGHLDGDAQSGAAHPSVISTVAERSLLEYPDPKRALHYGPEFAREVHRPGCLRSSAQDDNVP